MAKKGTHTTWTLAKSQTSTAQSQVSSTKKKPKR